MSTLSNTRPATATLIKHWVKDGSHPIARLLKNSFYALRTLDLPVIPGLHRLLYRLHLGVGGALSWLITGLYWKPLFRSRLSSPAPGLLLCGSGMPLVSGPLQIHCGARCRISTQTTFSGRWCSQPPPRLLIGDNVGIGWQTTIACGRRVVLGRNVRIAGGCLLAGYPGHPMNAGDRAEGKPDSDDQIGDIILEDDVWLGSGVRVMAGVRIGAATVVASGSVVTRDLPAGVLAGGIPARVLRQLEADQ